MSRPDHCVVCRGRDFEPALGELHRCRACGLVTYLGPLTSTSGELYDADYYTQRDYPDYVGQEASLRRSMRAHLEHVRRYWPPHGSLLEIGCAHGFFLQEAQPHFAEVMGIDVSCEAVRLATERGVPAVCGDFLTHDFGGRRFDCICLWDTVEHLTHPERFLEKASALLNRGGALFLTTGDIGSLNARFRGSRWRMIHPPTHLHYFSRHTIARLLSGAGLAVAGTETAAYYHTVYNVLASIALRPGWSATASRAVLRVLGTRLTQAVGFWINLGDIMFVAAVPAATSAPAAEVPRR